MSLNNIAIVLSVIALSVSMASLAALYITHERQAGDIQLNYDDIRTLQKSEKYDDTWIRDAFTKRSRDLIKLQDATNLLLEDQIRWKNSVDTNFTAIANRFSQLDATLQEILSLQSTTVKEVDTDPESPNNAQSTSSGPIIINNVSDSYKLGNTIIITGMASPNQAITLFIQYQDTETAVQRSNTTTNENGTFTIYHFTSQNDPVGTWKIHAETGKFEGISWHTLQKSNTITTEVKAKP